MKSTVLSWRLKLATQSVCRRAADSRFQVCGLTAPQICQLRLTSANNNYNSNNNKLCGLSGAATSTLTQSFQHGRHNTPIVHHTSTSLQKTYSMRRQNSPSGKGLTFRPLSGAVGNPCHGLPSCQLSACYALPFST